MPPLLRITFRILMAIQGVRCISAQYPEYYSPDEWITGFLHFIEYLKLSKPLVFGSDLGGYLLQLFVETYPESVCSIALCNSYRRYVSFMAQEVQNILNDAPVVLHAFSWCCQHDIITVHVLAL